ncbi:MAG: LacI family DNA-binding transcriptional regulator [Anaerolineae bacterium]|nr:LacI family DNA-binding transcriptional regulator [Anaerolineae bacterium]
MKITLRTIAEESGFSITTVSRALAGYDDVNAETRQHIIEIADRLGYQPNLTARHLRSQQTNTIGMIIPRTAHFSDPFYMELLSGVGREASEYGYDLLLSAQTRSEEELNSYRRIVGGSRVDGIVLARVLVNDPRIDYLQRQRYPFVVFGRVESGECPSVDVDGTAGIRQVIAHFVANGHRRIGVIRSSHALMFTGQRYAGYVQAMESLGLPRVDAYEVEGNLTQQSGQDAAARLLDLPEPPTAILAFNDLMALGAMAAVQQRGLTVGADVAVAGFDDISAAAGATPPLTTVRQPIHDIGSRLASMLIRQIQGQPLDEFQVLVKPELIIRASSRRR